MLAPALGSEKSVEILEDAAHRLGFGHLMSVEQAIALLGTVAQADGLVGIVGNLARSRLRLEAVRGKGAT